MSVPTSRDITWETRRNKAAIKPDPGAQESTSHTSPDEAQDSVLKIHQHLVDISRLTCESDNKLPQYQLKYKQAYLSERRKLLETVAAYNVLADANQRLEQENRYLKHQLIPHYENNLQWQEAANLEAKVFAQGLETKLHILERVSNDAQQKQARALEATNSSLKIQTERIAALEQQVGSAKRSPRNSIAQLRRSRRIRSKANVHTSERAFNGTKEQHARVKDQKQSGPITQF